MISSRRLQGDRTPRLFHSPPAFGLHEKQRLVRIKGDSGCGAIRLPADGGPYTVGDQGECERSDVREDRLLIARFNRGDAAAMRRIYHKYRDDLLKVAAALLYDRSAVEDVLHDVFVSFAEAAGRFKARGTLKGYLAICVANRARDRNRKLRRMNVNLDAARAAPSASVDPEAAAVSSERSRQLQEAMAQLPDEQREVIVLHLQGRLRFREIAALDGVSINTIQSRYRYGLDKLRSVLDGQVAT